LSSSVDEELLHLAFRSLRKHAAPGIDGQSYENYAVNLDPKLRDLHTRLKSRRYQAPVIRRVYVPKANGKRRPRLIRGRAFGSVDDPARPDDPLIRLP
jgi:RNA-directed DNA polymerase